MDIKELKHWNEVNRKQAMMWLKSGHAAIYTVCDQQGHAWLSYTLARGVNRTYVRNCAYASCITYSEVPNFKDQHMYVTITTLTKQGKLRVRRIASFINGDLAN